MQNDILRYIPQRPPFVMIDTLVKADDESTQTKFDVRADNVFVNNNELSAAALVENIAQTAAAGTGYQMQQSGQDTPGGYIGGVKNLKVERLPLAGETLLTEVTVLHRLFSAQKIAGKITIGDELIASCELQIFLQSAS